MVVIVNVSVALLTIPNAFEIEVNIEMFSDTLMYLFLNMFATSLIARVSILFHESMILLHLMFLLQF